MACRLQIIKTTTMFWVFNLNSLRSENSIVIPQKLLQNLQFLFYRCLVSELQRNPSLGGKTRIGTDKLATYFVRASHPVQGTRLFWGLKIPSQKLSVTGNGPPYSGNVYKLYAVSGGSPNLHLLPPRAFVCGPSRLFRQTVYSPVCSR